MCPESGQDNLVILLLNFNKIILRLVTNNLSFCGFPQTDLVICVVLITLPVRICYTIVIHFGRYIENRQPLCCSRTRIENGKDLSTSSLRSPIC
jgi:hypothetical protein